MEQHELIAEFICNLFAFEGVEPEDVLAALLETCETAEMGMDFIHAVQASVITKGLE